MPLFLSKKDMADLLVTAWEGGSNYWVEMAEYIPPKGMTMDALHALAWENLPDKEKEFWKNPKGALLYAMLPYLPPSVKWRIKFIPIEGGDVRYLTPQNMRRAIATLSKKDYDHVVRNIKNEEYDASDADAWLQAALFDDVIYG